MDTNQVDVSVVIVNWNTRDLLLDCLRSIHEAKADLGVQVVVVDNASSDGSVRAVERNFPNVQVAANGANTGFVRANNQALALCQGRYVLLLNSDAQVLPHTLEDCVSFMDAHPSAGILGVRLLNPDGSFQASYTRFPTLWREFLILSGLGRLLVRPTFPSCGPEFRAGPQKIEGYLEGAYLMARRVAMEAVGNLDECIFMYAEDVDWCYRFWRLGWEVWYLPQVSVIHVGGQSTKKRQGRMEAELYRSRVYFFRKHYGKWAAYCLAAIIYLMTGVKLLGHGVLRSVTNGRRGRNVTSWQELHMALSSVGSAFGDRMTS